VPSIDNQYDEIFFPLRSITTLTERHENECGCLLTEAECWKSLKSIQPNKSPGTDELSQEFHKKTEDRKLAKNNNTPFFYVLYTDKKWVFEQSEHAELYLYYNSLYNFLWDGKGGKIESMEMTNNYTL